MVDWIYDDKCASACFFRSSVQPPKRKMMLQITQKCNLHCAHCFANGKCPIGSVLYVFTNGDVAICPYMVFAANGENRYNAKDFILGNIFGNEELDLSTEIKKFIKHYLMQNTAYKNCGACSKGCYAIKISNDQDLSDCDFDICPLAGSKTK